MLLVWGPCWGRYTNASLPDKDDDDYNHPTNQPTNTIPPIIGLILLVWGSGKSVVLLLSYLIKITMVTTPIIATFTPPISPAMGPIVLVWGANREDCTTTTIATATPPTPPAMGPILLYEALMERFVLHHYRHGYTINTSRYGTNNTFPSR
jgi:hypothetical protein